MSFNRPFIVPKMFTDAVVDVRRNLDDDTLKASDIIEIFVISPIYDDDSAATKINDYHLTRFTDLAFDIQIMFNEPSQISAIITEPDKLIVRLKKNSKFKEAETFINDLDMDSSIETIEIDLIP